MKIQILLDGQVANTQIVSEALYTVKPTLREAKLIALKAALEDRAIKLSDSLRATSQAESGGQNSATGIRALSFIAARSIRVRCAGRSMWRRRLVA